MEILNYFMELVLIYNYFKGGAVAVRHNITKFIRT